MTLNLIPCKMLLFLTVLLKSKKMKCTKTILHILWYCWNTSFFVLKEEGSVRIGCSEEYLSP